MIFSQGIHIISLGEAFVAAAFVVGAVLMTALALHLLGVK
jgi:hypothetical protein